MKLHKIAAPVLAVILAAGAFSAIPQEFAHNSGIIMTAHAVPAEYETKEIDGVKYITSYIGNGGSITLPKGYAIDENAFRNNNSITSVTVPRGYPVTAVGKGAFSNMGKLKKVVFEEAVEISEQVFNASTALEKVEFRNGVKNRIGRAAFASCINLKSVSMGEHSGEFVIEQGAFFCCIALKSFTIPQGCTEIRGNAFHTCPSLTELVIPENVSLGSGNSYFGFMRGTKYLSSAEKFDFVTNGKNSAYVEYIKYYSSGTEMKWKVEKIKLISKKLTVTVPSGSEAEKFAIENGIAYQNPYDPTEEVTEETTVQTEAVPEEEEASESTDTAVTADSLPAPEGLTGEPASDSVVLTWQSVEGADGYRIYMLDSETGKYRSCANVKSAKYTVDELSPDTEYRFRVAPLVKTEDGYTAGAASKSIAVTTLSAE